MGYFEQLGSIGELQGDDCELRGGNSSFVVRRKSFLEMTKIRARFGQHVGGGKLVKNAAANNSKEAWSCGENPLFPRKVSSANHSRLSEHV